MSRIPVEEIKVARWYDNNVDMSDDKNKGKHTICLTNSQAGESASSTKEMDKEDTEVGSDDKIDETPTRTVPKKKYLCIRVDREAELEFKTTYPDHPKFHVTDRGSFAIGRPLHPSSPVSIWTYGGSTQYMLRVVCDWHPFGGISARGHEENPMNTVFFHAQLKHHLKWICRKPSPFLSMTPDPFKADAVVKYYQERGATGIRILLIDLWHPDWNRDLQRIFDLGELVESLGLTDHLYYRHEFIVSHSIPPGAIKETTWIEEGGFARKIRLEFLLKKEWEREKRKVKQEAEKRAAGLHADADGEKSRQKRPKRRNDMLRGK